MNTIFDSKLREELKSRVAQLDESKKAAWGKMNVFQMVMHNTYWNGWMLGTDPHTYRQEWLGKIFGKFALNSMIKNEKPLDKNIPTSEQFKVKESTCDLETEKAKWLRLIDAYQSFDNPNFVHDFFGKMSKDQIGILVYKHTDHHLRQFGV